MCTFYFWYCRIIQTGDKSKGNPSEICLGCWANTCQSRSNAAQFLWKILPNFVWIIVVASKHKMAKISSLWSMWLNSDDFKGLSVPSVQQMWPDLSTTLHSCALILSGPKQCQSNALHLLEPRVKGSSGLVFSFVLLPVCILCCVTSSCTNFYFRYF